MKHLKKFESYRSREEMCDSLCKVCGYEISELEGMSDSEIQDICNEKEAEMTSESKVESDDVDNYMFFANLDNICRMVTEISEMDHSEIDRMLTKEHDWAADHISKSKESISHVYSWLKSTKSDNNPEIGME